MHVHILPRTIGDFDRNDQVYEEIWKQRLDQAFDLDQMRKDFDDTKRKIRTLEEMVGEATDLRKLFPENLPRESTDPRSDL